jgi:hypothetical protein
LKRKIKSSSDRRLARHQKSQQTSITSQKDVNLLIADIRIGILAKSEEEEAWKISGVERTP